MGVASTVNKWIYVLNGSLTTYQYTTKIFDDTDLVVEIVGDTTETLTLTTDYSVSGVGSDNGGEIELVDAGTSGDKLVIRKVLPITQGTDLVENDPNRAEVMEDALDKLTMLNQQIQEQIDRSVLQDVTQTTPITLPTASANKILGWNAAGDGIENKTALDTDVQAACEAAQTAAEEAQTAAELAETNAEAAQAAIEAVSPVSGLGTVNPTNLLSNGDFEAWSAGVSAAPDGWVNNGDTGTVIAREGTIKKLGSYSLKLTSGATYQAYAFQTVDVTTKSVDYWKGRTVSFGCWVYTDTSSRVTMRVYDGVGFYDTNVHTGNSTWQWLSGTATISSSANVLRIYCGVGAGAAVTMYFDGAMLVEGSSAFAFSPKPAEEGVWSDYFASSTIVGWSAGKTGTIYTKKIGKTVFVRYLIDGTSDNATTTFTVPYVSSVSCYFAGFAIDNGGTKVAAANQTSGSSDVVTLKKDPAGGAFTASGAKQVTGQFFYESA
jgi:hypothetical protein